MADRKTLLAWSFGLALAGGILVLVGVLDALALAGDLKDMNAFLPGDAFDGFGRKALREGLFGLPAGILMLVAATRLRAAPQDAQTWGVVALVCGIVALSLGPETLGALLGVAAGAVALVAAGRA